jgi:Mg2+ and Co2+ transporter CorA
MQGGGGFFGFGGGGGDKNVGKNPPKGAVIPFYLKSAPDSLKGSVTVMDKNRNVIKTFSTDSKDNKLEVKEGLNMFAWDLNYPEGEKVPETVILWNRARMVTMAPPGEYIAKFKMGNDSAETKFTVLADPNYKVTQEEYEAQFNFLRKAQGKFDEVIKAQKDMGELRKQMTDLTSRWGKDCPKEIKDMTESIGKKITGIEEALHQTKAKSGQDVLNFPIKLDDKLSSVYRVAATGQGAPTKQVLEAYEVVASQIDAELAKLKDIMNNEVPKLNGLIREKSLPVIGLKK